LVRESIGTTKPVSASPEPEGAAFARYYDLDVADEREDIDKYLALASASDGPVLELACGTGRVCIPLAAADHRVTGVDRDPHMLERARVAWERRTAGASAKDERRLELVRGDITSIQRGKRFDLVILAFNSLLLLSGEGERAAALATMHRHLTPNGRAVLDIWQPSAVDLELYDGRVIDDWTKLDPETGDQVTKSTIATYDSAERRATIRTRYHVEPGDGPARRLERTDEIAFVSHGELMAEMAAAGLQVQAEVTDTGPNGQPQTDRVMVVAAPIGASIPHQSY
jgi:SAM-dependent methyltransferase